MNEMEDQGSVVDRIRHKTSATVAKWKAIQRNAWGPAEVEAQYGERVIVSMSKAEHEIFKKFQVSMSAAVRDLERVIDSMKQDMGVE